MKRVGLGVAALSALLTACAGPTPREQAMEGMMLALPELCNAQRFRCIPINIQSNQIQDPGKAYFQAANHVILWTLPQAYTFPDDGITITSASPTDEFTCRPALQGRLFLCINRHTNSSSSPIEYKYKIKVNGIGTPLDPHIVNN